MQLALFTEVLECLFPEWCGVGALARLTHVSKGLNTSITTNELMWKYAARLLNVRHCDYAFLMKSMRGTQRCRECGRSTQLEHLVCSKCATDEAGYFRMVDRWQIATMLRRQAWRPRTSGMHALTRARRGRALKHVYWFYQVERLLQQPLAAPVDADVVCLALAQSVNGSAVL